MALKLLRSKHKYESKTKRKIAHVLRVPERHYHRSCSIRILSHISTIKTAEKDIFFFWVSSVLKNPQWLLEDKPHSNWLEQSRYFLV